MKYGVIQHKQVLKPLCNGLMRDSNIIPIFRRVKQAEVKRLEQFMRQQRAAERETFPGGYRNITVSLL